MQPYIVISGVLVILTIFAFTQQTPQSIFDGLVKINMTRGVLITDYIEIGGLGAAFINGSVISFISLALLLILKIKPTGAIVMSLFLTFGFALFGKDLLNMIPITIGVWLYSRVRRRPYSDYYVIGLLAATISPITSELIFLNISFWHVNVISGIIVGIISGFLFPMVSEYAAKVMQGFNLYCMGFSGGLLATLFVAILLSLGIEIEPEYHISGGNNFEIGILLIIISCFLIICGLIFGDRKSIWSDLSSAMKCPGTLSSDFYAMFGANMYINMGLLCLLGTLIVVVIGAELNGPTIAGIFTITGFGVFGKHLKNVVPLISGAIIATFVNKWDPTYTSNILGILFSAGLAPISGKYGMIWGVIAGFLHVCILHHIGILCNGLNLYNNGFAAGFVVILLIPIINGIEEVRRNRGK